MNNKNMNLKAMKTSLETHFNPPTIGDKYIYNGLPCWVIDVATDGAWFGVVEGIKRIDRNKDAFRRYDATDFPTKVIDLEAMKIEADNEAMHSQQMYEAEQMAAAHYYENKYGHQ